MIDKQHIRIDLGQAGYSQLPQTAWEMDMLAQRFRYVRKRGWNISGHYDLEMLVGTPPTMVVHDSDGDRNAYFREMPGHEASAYVTISHSYVSVTVAAETLETVNAVLAVWQGKIPAETRPGAIEVKFWHYGKHGPNSMTRQVDVPKWDDVHGNYPAAVRAKLQALLGTFPPSRSGQLVLWHGVPGTGKTWALRALIAEWAAHCKCDYITDSDNFFGVHPDYMMSVLFSGHDDEPPVIDKDAKPPVSGWRLLVLEDAGELLVPDARTQVGQALSRLLNVVDGLVGQGLKLLVLITTNEPLGKVHPAVARPGRCAARIEFDAFPAADARAWLQARQPGASMPAKSHTLAELYALAQDADVPTPEPVIGFAPAEVMV